MRMKGGGISGAGEIKRELRPEGERAPRQKGCLLSSGPQISACRQLPRHPSFLKNKGRMNSHMFPYLLDLLGCQCLLHHFFITSSDGDLHGQGE